MSRHDGGEHRLWGLGDRRVGDNGGDTDLDLASISHGSIARGVSAPMDVATENRSKCWFKASERDQDRYRHKGKKKQFQTPGVGSGTRSKREQKYERYVGGGGELEESSRADAVLGPLGDSGQDSRGTKLGMSAHAL